jgi:hypothetical protein
LAAGADTLKTNKQSLHLAVAALHTSDPSDAMQKNARKTQSRVIMVSSKPPFPNSAGHCVYSLVGEPTVPLFGDHGSCIVKVEYVGSMPLMRTNTVSRTRPRTISLRMIGCRTP